MRKLISQAAISLLIGGAVMSAFAGGPDMPPAPMITPGLYLGLGGSWNTIDKVGSYSLNYTNTANVAYTYNDQQTENQSRLAPMIQLGYWAPIDNEWLWGLQAIYKYINYRTPNNYVGLPNFSTALTNNDVNGAYYAYNRMQNEFMITLFFGYQFTHGYLYLGAGPVLFTLNNTVAIRGTNTSVTPATALNASTRNLTSSKTIWGGEGQLGYNYYFDPTWYLGFNYTYAVSATYNFNRNASAVALGLTPTRTANVTAQVNASEYVTVQEVMFSINKVFAM